MKESFVVAKCFDFNTIRLVIFSNALKDDIDYVLLKDDISYEKLNLVRQNSLHGIAFFEFSLPKKIELGHKYNVIIPNFGSVSLDVNDLSMLEEFDEMYFYNGNDLGATYSNKMTKFAVWAPLASRVVLKYILNNETVLVEMVRTDKGVYRATIKKDLDGANYVYLVTNSGDTNTCFDPYGHSSFINGLSSAVINPSKTKFNMYDNRLPKMLSYCDSIIYEGHVRDLTISPDTNIVNKGLFLGLCEENRKTKCGNPAGLDYIKFLGVTHLQLLPVLDYVTVDENKPFDSYNWGYDPQQYFTLDGSYSTNPNDPYARINEFKALVSTYHKNGIRINLDVVYNHVYAYQFSLYERLVPNYFFRRKENGKMSDCSGCGNDLATEKRMVRKLIVDSCTFLVKEYHIDGLRFDLMGLIDVDTLKEIEENVFKVKKDFMLYGEGWNMTRLPNHLMGNMDNSASLKKFGFFNDRFREIVKGGGGYKIYERGYGLNNYDFREGFKFAYCGCSLNYVFPKLFISPSQSVNYIECHDNETLYDKLLVSMDEENLNQRLKRINFLNSVTMFSFGIPFFHAGQEIGMTKHKKDNTYKDNSGVNTFSYDMLDKRFYMAKYFSDLAKTRKEMPSMRLNNANKVETSIDIINLENNGLLIKFKNDQNDCNYNNIKLFFNPSLSTIYYELDDYYFTLINSNGRVFSDFLSKNVMVSPVSTLILFTK